MNNCSGTIATIQFQHDTEQCLDQLVEYQCTRVTGTGGLRWRISGDDGTQFSVAIGGGTVTIGVFTVERLQPSSPVVSNISFTVQSSINGYTIVCEDSFTPPVNSESLIINIPGIVISFGLIKIRVAMYKS